MSTRYKPVWLKQNNKNLVKLYMVVLTHNLKKLRQEECCKFEASLSYKIKLLFKTPK